MTEMDLERQLQAAARNDFLTFLRAVFAAVAQGDRFLPNWHLEAIAHELQRIEKDESNRLIVTIPPRSLKSITISVAWVAWLLGHDPRLRIICVSYSADLAQKHARDCRAVMSSDWYRALFPATILKGGGEMDLYTTAGGGRLATSVGGTLTGRGGDIIVIDDPMKPEEAASASAREKVWDWYRNTLSSRLNDKRTGAIVLVMQRLHEDDLAGHLLEAGGWVELKLAAIAEEAEEIALGGGRLHRRAAGEALHAAREDLARLEAQKRIMGSAVFSAQYQQQPVPADGVIIDRGWLRNYKAAPERGPGDLVVQSWDTATATGETNDFSVCITALIRKGKVYILDVHRARHEFPALVRQVKHLAREHRPDVLLIEDAASGTQLIQALRDEAPEGVPLPIARKPDGDKRLRFEGQTPRIEAGELILPEDAPWLAGFVRELLGFPNTRHDDQVDALSQLLAWCRRRRQEPVLALASEFVPHFTRELKPDWGGRY